MARLGRAILGADRDLQTGDWRLTDRTGSPGLGYEGDFS